MLPGVVRDVVATEGYAFVANGQHGLRVVDVTDPSAPVEVAHFLPEGFVRARAVALDGTDLYVDFGSPGIYLLDVTDPAGPVLLGSHPAISGGEIMALAA